MNSSLTVQDRIAGCLLGGACGDALGAPVEFLSLAQIRARYGPKGITDFDEAYGVVGAITDDTQMTLFTAEGFALAAAAGTDPIASIDAAYLRWFETQRGAFRKTNMEGALIKERGLWAARAPGDTCLSALSEKRPLGTPARNNSKGCGGVMRVAPLGFVYADLKATFELAAAAARLTHGHPSGYLSAGALAVMIAVIATGEPVFSAANVAIIIAARRQGSGEVVRSIRRAIELACRADWRKRLPELGQGWVAEEALAIAVLCAIRGRSAEAAIVAAVDHDGDSDSTGAITGNIVGALYGASALPGRWLEQLELRDVIDQTASDLVRTGVC